MRWRETAAELLLGGECPGCGRPGWRLCAACRVALLGEPRRVSRRVAGLPPVWACADYEGPAHRLVVGAKERGVWRALPDLGEALARAVAAAMLDVEAEAATLVPVPSARASVRQRGIDATRELAAAAARVLRDRAVVVACAPVLAQRRRVRDQAGLGAADRFANLSEALGVVAAPPAGPLLVVDDVVTTGASLLAATSALRAAGGDVVAAACVAARGWR